MIITGFTILLRAGIGALLLTSVAACSTAPGQSQAVSFEKPIYGWIDAAGNPSNISPEYPLISNRGDLGN